MVLLVVLLDLLSEGRPRVANTPILNQGNIESGRLADLGVCLTTSGPKERHCGVDKETKLRGVGASDGLDIGGRTWKKRQKQTH